MISTQNPAALPAAAALQRLCQALAVLDALNSPDEEYRYHTYDAHWGDGEQVFQMNDGEGDQLLILFRPEGCVINGYADGLPEPDKRQLTRGLPPEFHEFLFGEPVSSIGTTFCLWYTPAHGWHTGPPESEDDGSEELLYILDGQPATYVAWATEYFDEGKTKKALDPATVGQLYRGEELTRASVLQLADEPHDWPQLEADLREIKYPYDFN